MSISFLSTARLPTEKAYGVTILESCKAAQKLGLEFLVFAPGNKENSGIESLKQIPSLKLPRTLRSQRVFPVRRFFFRFNSILAPLICQFYADFRKSSFVWLRDPISAYVLSVISPNKKLLLEIHHRPVGLGKTLHRKLSKRKNLSFAGISNQLISEMRVDVPGIRMFEAPMGVPSEFFFQSRLTLNESYSRFLYMGKGQSSGNDNGLQILLGDFSRALRIHPDLTLTFLGLEPNYKALISNEIASHEISDTQVKFIDHILHIEIPKVLGEFDVGILPYPSTTYNNERFPLKSLEYAASGLTMIVSRINSHLDLIGEQNAYFYVPGEEHSFEDVVENLIKNPTLRLQKASTALHWANEHTYEKRIHRVISEWLGKEYMF